MPTFGEYETIGEPLATVEERGHLTTVWQARKAGAAGAALYVVKCYAPRLRLSTTGDTDAPLGKDHRLEFIEGIKQQKKAQTEGGHCLAPIHAFGMDETGAWYVTDFFPRNNLRALVGKRVRMDSPGLRHVIHSVVMGCLSLKQSRGYSHGNLKAANVYLVGKPRPLRETPLYLTDPYPAAPLQLSELDPGDKKMIGELLGDVVEVQDLKAIGELIFQLVESRLVTNALEINWPIQPSRPWEALGKEGETWRQLCNQLLDPRLSLSQIRLEALEKKVRPSVVEANRTLILVTGGGICLVAAVTLGVVKWQDARKNGEYKTHFEAAQQAQTETNLVVSRKEIDLALKVKPREPAAMELKTRIDQLMEQYGRALATAQGEFKAGRTDKAANALKTAFEVYPEGSLAKEEQDYQQAVLAARACFDRKDYTNAVARAELVLSRRPGDDIAARVKDEARGQIDEQNYRSAMTQAQAAFDRKDYALALTEANVALGIKVNERAAAKLKADAQQQIDLASKSKAEEENYRTAMTQAQAAFDRKDYREALTRANVALGIRATDRAATKLKIDAQKQLDYARELKSQEENYQAAIKQAHAAFDRKDYDEALTQANVALGNRANDRAAALLKADAQKHLEAVSKLKTEEQSYQAAMKLGQAAFGRKDYGAALTQANVALGIRTNDVAAATLKLDAQKQLEAAAGTQQREQGYQAAMKEGKAAFDRKEYGEALTQANVALGIRTNDVAAATLKTDAQKELDLANKLKSEEQNYQAAMKSGQAAFDRKDFGEALTRANVALGVRTNDVAALTLKTDTQKQLDLAASTNLQEQNYQAAVKDGKAAFGRKDFIEAFKQADIALGIKTNDVTASTLKRDAQQQLDLAAAKLQDQKYQSAIEEGRAAFARKDYSNTIAQANLALGIRKNDRTALDLRKQAEDAKGTTKIVVGPLVTNLFGISFAWVPGVRTNGAYVAITELSHAQFRLAYDQMKLDGGAQWRAIVQGPGNPVNQIAGTEDDLPISLRQEHADELVRNLNQQGKYSGRFALPNLQDFLVFAQVDAGLVDPASGKFAGNGDLARKTFGDTKLFWTGIGASTPGERAPRKVKDGVANSYGLFNTVGNAWEWSAEAGTALGLSAASEGRGTGATLKRGFIRSECISARLMFIPGPR